MSDLPVGLPDGFGKVVLANFVFPSVVLIYLGGRVAGGRKKYNCDLPNTQAIAGHKTRDGKVCTEDQANAFNSLQRGHYNALESITSFSILSFIAAFVSVNTTAVFGLMWGISRISYGLGYDGKGSRYSGGFRVGGLHWISLLGTLGMSAYQGYKWM